MSAPADTATPGSRRGQVSEFDEAVGLGLVTTAAGESFPFHCTRIADGSRTIAVGTEVTFSVTAGRLGRWEASEVSPTA